MARRATGRHGPNGVAHVLQKEIGLNGQTQGWLQWGICEAVHSPRFTNTTLSSNASAGATTIDTTAACFVNDLLKIGSLTQAIQVTAVSGTGPYTVTLKQALPSNQSNGAVVQALWTVDLYINGTQNLATPPQGTFLTIGVRLLEGWNPIVGDVVPISRGPAGLISDRFVFRELAGARGPGSSCFVGLVTGVPPSTYAWGQGAMFLDPFDYKFYVCVTASIQNSAGVVTTPAVFKSTTLS